MIPRLTFDDARYIVRRTAALLANAAMAATAVACGDEVPAVAPTTVAAPSVSQLGGYSTFSADVVVETSVSSATASVPTATPNVRTFHVSSTQVADGSWETTLTLPPRVLPFVVPAQVSEAIDVARIEINGKGESRSFTRTGKLISAPSPEKLSARAHAEANANALKRKIGTVPTDPGKRNSATWLRGFIARGDSGVLLRSSLEKQFGKAVRRDNVEDVYSRSLRDTTVEVHLNSRVGEVDRIAYSIAGSAFASITYGFSEIAPGTFARTSAETARLQRDGSRITTRVSYTNVRMSR